MAEGALYIVLRGNAYFPRGEWLEEDAEGNVQAVEMEKIGKSLQPSKAYGLSFPLMWVRQHCLKVQRSGIDGENTLGCRRAVERDMEGRFWELFGVDDVSTRRQPAPLDLAPLEGECDRGAPTQAGEERSPNRGDTYPLFGLGHDLPEGHGGGDVEENGEGGPVLPNGELHDEERGNQAHRMARGRQLGLFSGEEGN